MRKLAHTYFLLHRPMFNISMDALLEPLGSESDPLARAEAGFARREL